MRDVAIATCAEYAAEDADVTLQLYHAIEQQLKSEKLDAVCGHIDFPLIPSLVELEFNGVKIDTELLGHISKELERNAQSLETEIYTLAGFTFNINSPKQLGEVLFDKLHLPAQRKTKTGYSTDVAVLEELANLHPVPAKILEFRQTVKLKSTYVDVLPKQINPRTGLIHTTYSQNVAATGRLSSIDPHLQNIPRSAPKWATKSARRSSRVRNGMLIVSADYSQIELRVMAHVCGDEGLSRRSTTARIFARRRRRPYIGVPPGEVTGEMRRRSKTVNFGIMYGLGSRSGFRSGSVFRSRNRKRSFRTYFERFPGVKKYIDGHDCVRARARLHGNRQRPPPLLCEH